MPRIGLYILLAAASFVLTACAPPEPIRIGFLGGLSGWSPDFGIDGLNGTRLAIELRNKAGGIKGRPIELIEADDQQNPEIARQAVTRLIDQKVAAIVGPMTSAMAVATVPQLNEARILMISPSVTTNELSGLDDHFFRVSPATRDFVKTSADFYFHTWGLRKLRLIYDLNNRAFTENWSKDFSQIFSASGGTLLKPLPFSSSEETNYPKLAREALLEHPDGIILVANSVDTAMFCASIRKLDSTIRIGTSEWASTGRLIELGGTSVEGIAVEHFFDLNGTQPAYTAFLAAFVSRFGQYPSFGGVYAFDATNIILDALEKKPAEQSLKQQLLASKSLNGVQDPIAFDSYGDPPGKTYIFVVKNGVFEAAPPTP